MSRNEVYISIPFLFPYIKLLYPPVRRQRRLLIYCNVHKKDMTQFFFFFLLLPIHLFADLEKRNLLAMCVKEVISVTVVVCVKEARGLWL
jgi:hypothetical protein